MQAEQHSSACEVDVVLPAKGTKEFIDFRDRAAYVYITGAFPTHLRTRFTALLRGVTTHRREPTGLDGRVGTVKLDAEAIARLDLESHPMVRKVKGYIQQGYRIQTLRGRSITVRRPFSKIYLFREEKGIALDHITVQIDGSVKDHWD